MIHFGQPPVSRLKKPRIEFVAAFVLTAAILAPCAGSSAAGGGPSLASIKATIQKFEGIPAFTPPGPPIDAGKAKGKSIFYISLSTENAFQNNVTTALQEAATATGVNFFSYPNNGQVSQYVAGMQEAIQRHPDLIILGSITPDLIVPQIKMARQAGIAVMATHQANPATYPPGTLGSLPQAYKELNTVVYGPFTEAARLEADYVVAATQAKANVLIVTANNIEQSPGIVATIKDEFAKACGNGCDVSTVDVPTTRWAADLLNQTQASLAANPRINYIIPIYDSMSTFVVPGIVAAGRSANVKVVTYNGTVAILRQMQSNQIVAADVGENPVELGLIDMDQALRVLTGTPTNPESKQGLRIFTQQNVNEAGTPAQPGEGYGSTYKTGFARLWRLPASVKL